MHRGMHSRSNFTRELREHAVHAPNSPAIRMARDPKPPSLLPVGHAALGSLEFGSSRTRMLMGLLAGAGFALLADSRVNPLTRLDQLEVTHLGIPACSITNKPGHPGRRRCSLVSPRRRRPS